MHAGLFFALIAPLVAGSDIVPKTQDVIVQGERIPSAAHSATQRVVPLPPSPKRFYDVPEPYADAFWKRNHGNDRDDGIC